VRNVLTDDSQIAQILVPVGFDPMTPVKPLRTRATPDKRDPTQAGEAPEYGLPVNHLASPFLTR
jgi:hypothetical protein